MAVAVIGAVAAALPERPAGKKADVSPVQQFGELPKPEFAPKAEASRPAAAVAADRQALLKLAAYSVPRDAKPTPNVMSFAGSPPPAAAPPAASPIPAPSPVQPTAPAAVPQPATASVEPAMAETQQPSAPKPATRVAALPPPAPPASAGKSGGPFNINRASVEQLDHLPGGGRIGQAIARRRPYHSIDDLVRKRVLREAAFRRIKSAITVD